MEPNKGMSSEPPSRRLILVDIQVVHHDVELAAGVSPQHLIHKAEKVGWVRSNA